MKKENYEIATFAAGCFWGVEAAFRQIKGVKSTRVGYTGGQMENPTYEDVCADETGHAEAVEVTFDPKKLPYEKLLDVFWQNHNPTLGNRQGPDVGTQYRSAIFYHNKNQKELAINSMNELQKKLDKTITTEKQFIQRKSLCFAKKSSKRERYDLQSIGRKIRNESLSCCWAGDEMQSLCSNGALPQGSLFGWLNRRFYGKEKF